MDRRRGIISEQGEAPQIVDTSCTTMGEYSVTKVSTTRKFTGARASGSFRCYYATSASGNYSGALYKNVGASETTIEVSASILRIKVGNSSAATQTNPVSINMDDAYLYHTATGNIIFAGPDTRYYGMSNIDGTLATPGWTPAMS